jgi:hypothetical protein
MMRANKQYNIRQVYIGSYVTNLIQPIMKIIDAQPRGLSALSMKSIIMLL